MSYLWIGVGSALGGMCRHHVATLVGLRWGDHFPFGTLAVNVIGSVAIGALAGLIESMDKPEVWAVHQPLWLIGFLGGIYHVFIIQSPDDASADEWEDRSRSCLRGSLCSDMCAWDVSWFRRAPRAG